MPQVGSNSPLATAAANYVTQNTAAVQQVQSLTKFDIYPYTRVIVQQTGWRGVRKLFTRPERVALRRTNSSRRGRTESWG